jgi:hypothetical protein
VRGVGCRARLSSVVLALRRPWGGGGVNIYIGPRYPYGYGYAYPRYGYGYAYPYYGYGYAYPRYRYGHYPYWRGHARRQWRRWH